MPEMIPGIRFDFGGGRVKVIPPLSLGALQRLQGGLTALQATAAISPEAIGTVMAASYSALKRNYPDITEDEVGELVDVGNMAEVISCLMDVSGVKRKEAELAEKNAAAQPPTGETSMATGQD